MLYPKKLILHKKEKNYKCIVFKKTYVSRGFLDFFWLFLLISSPFLFIPVHFRSCSYIRFPFLCIPLHAFFIPVHFVPVYSFSFLCISLQDFLFLSFLFIPLYSFNSLPVVSRKAMAGNFKNKKPIAKIGCCESCRRLDFQTSFFTTFHPFHSSSVLSFFLLVRRSENAFGQTKT